MKQAKVEYKMTPNGVLFVGFKNVMSIKEIDEALSRHSYDKYFSGRAFYRLYNADRIVRIFSASEFGPEEEEGIHFIDFEIGKLYSGKEWSFFIKFLKEAGERFSAIHREQDKTYVVSI